MDKIELLNKLKWQIYMRSPKGGIYKKCVERLCDDNINMINMAFNGEYLNMNVFEMFIRGYYSTDRIDINKFFDYLLLDDNINIVLKNNIRMLEFNIYGKMVYIPYPKSLEELASLRFELLDLILPYMISSVENFNNISFNEGPYEYIGKYVVVRLKSGDTVLDLGANFGLFSTYAASLGCNVYAFEPLTKAIIEYLEEERKIYSNINIVNRAISSSANKDVILNIDENNFGGSYIGDVEDNDKKGILVETETIDNFVSSNGLNQVDFLKADIEGQECEMLEGAKETLKFYHPKLAICKYHKLNDEKNIKKLILSANPNYVIESNWKKIYAEYKK